MDVFDALRARRSTKRFLTREVPRSELQGLIDVARYSPSGGNKNSWRFIAITERKSLDRLSEIHPNCRWLASAQAGIAVLVDPASTRYWLEDCSVATYSIWLASTARGLGVAWGAMYLSDNPAESERRQGFVREVLSIPSKFTVPVVLGIGYPDSPPPERKRPSLEDIFYWESYSDGNSR